MGAFPSDTKHTGPRRVGPPRVNAVVKVSSSTDGAHLMERTGNASGAVTTLVPVPAAGRSSGSVPCAHMPRAARITSADLLRAVHRAGWITSRQSGSHMILVHPGRAGARVVVPVHAGRVLKPKTLAAILKSAGITGDELAGLL